MATNAIKAAKISKLLSFSFEIKEATLPPIIPIPEFSGEYNDISTFATNVAQIIEPILPKKTLHKNTNTDLKLI